MNTIEHQQQEAQTTFEHLSLPKEREEAWRHTFIEKLALESFLSFQEPIISLTAPKDAVERGAVFCDMRTAIRKHAELVAPHFLKIASLSDKMIALAASQWKNGVFLYVPKKVHIDEPFIATLRSSANTALYHLIIIESESSVNYLEESEYFCEQESLSCSLGEISVGENASLSVHSLCLASSNHRHFGSFVGEVKQDATLNWFWASFGGKLNRTRMDTKLIGKGASTENNGVFIGKNKEHLDATTNVLHKNENTTNNMKINGIMKDSASSIYRGLIKITKEGRGTNSYLSNHILKLSEDARANSIPALEIDNNEVKASHGATVGQIDEEQLFYLKSRGLTKEEAEHLIVGGFFEPIVEKIVDKYIRERFHKSIERAR